MRSCVYSVFIGAYVFYLQLYLIFLEDILLDGICYVETALALDVSGRRTLSKGNSIDHIARLGVYQFQLDVLLFSAHHLAGAVIIYVLRAEYGFAIAWTKR